MPEDFSGTPSLTSRLTARFCVLVRMVRMRTPAAAGSMVLLQSTATRSLALRSASAVLVSSQNRAISLRPTWLQCQHQKHRSLQQEGSKLRLSSTSPSPDDPSLEVPAVDEVLSEVAQQLRDLLDAAGGSAVALTGAGMSTDSGIPDYRGPQGSYSRGHKPMTHDEFLSSESNRKRYWARSTFGWDSFSQAKPNAAHVALAGLEAAGKVSSVITQNVDGLQQKAGSRKVIDLHGRNDKVECMSCRVKSSRNAYQANLARLNAPWIAEHSPELKAARKGTGGAADAGHEGARTGDPSVHLRADGDADVEPGAYLGEFVVPACEQCGGVLKPTVVFFGDNIPRSRVEETYRLVDESSLLIAAGSSLQVYSAYRLMKRAADAGKKLVVINLGDTRAERSGLDILKVEAGVSSVLPQLL